ncbi:MAG: hypothetical protein WDO13_02510 [Verrucomicrobiota bacterium]
MGYLICFPEQSFTWSPSGDRLFCPYAPFLRPYILPDEATERRLGRREARMEWIGTGGLLAILLLVFPHVVPLSRYLDGLSLIAITWSVVNWLLVQGELKGLQRAPARLSLRDYYRDVAGRLSREAIGLGCLGSLFFLLYGACMLVAGVKIATALGLVVLSGLCFAAWFYCRKLKDAAE